MQIVKHMHVFFAAALSLLLATAQDLLPPASGKPVQQLGQTNQTDLFDMLQLSASGRKLLRHSSKRKLSVLEQELRPLLATLPTSTGGTYGPTAVRYALHKHLLRKHAWLVKGLDPQGQAWNSMLLSEAKLFKDLPEDVRTVVKLHLTGPGFVAKDVALLAWMLKKLVHKEARRQLRKIYRWREVPLNRPANRGKVHMAVALFMSSFIMGSNTSNMTHSELFANFISMDDLFPTWPIVLTSLDLAVKERAPQGRMSFADAVLLASLVTEKLGEWQQPGCVALKKALMKMEDRGSGRVRLAEFYGTSLHDGKWQFSESIDYLRQLGALDESNPNNLRVIIPNYVYGASNCIAPTRYLSVSCLSECEVILSELERSFGKPEVFPTDVVAHIMATPSSTVPANRSLSTIMLHRLNSIAGNHSGRVPLHSRLFAQWMHHAYPRECPYPHVAGKTRPLDLDDWARTGLDVVASTETMAAHAGANASVWKSGRHGWTAKSRPIENAAWSYEEEVFVPADAGTHPAGWMVISALNFAACAIVALSLMLARLAGTARRAARSALHNTAAPREAKLFPV